MGRLESYDVLKKLFWLSKLGHLNIKDVELVVTDRSTICGTKTIKLDYDSVLMKDRIVLSDTHIPLHRIEEIRLEGKCLWRKSGGAQKRL